MPITLTLYRGEKNQWWPTPEIRLMYGMTLLEPWTPSSINNLWARLKSEVNRQLGLTVQKKAAAYGQYLRATGRPFALATAWTFDGSFRSDYNYVITIPNAWLYYWGGTTRAPDLGTPVDPSKHDVTADFVVLNAETIAASTILGFGHKTGTREITFFHDLPLELITSCNGTPTASLRIKKWGDLTYEQKIEYRKFKR